MSAERSTKLSSVAGVPIIPAGMAHVDPTPRHREIAEAFCEMHHIPTRTEMDEVQRAVYELRRELRALHRQGEGELAQAAPAPRSGKRPAAKAKASLPVGNVPKSRIPFFLSHRNALDCVPAEMPKIA